MVQFTPELADKVVLKMLEKAIGMEQSAGFGGSWGDGGAGRLRDAIKAFEAGRDGRWPDKEWEDIAEKLVHESDPEWETYQRLRKKFNDPAA